MPLVVKRILPHLSTNQRFVDMFVIEAKIYVALQHQNIVQIYGFRSFKDSTSLHSSSSRARFKR